MKKYLFLLLLIGGKLFAANYYVSNTGSDAANGLTTSTPWISISKVNAYAFLANDSILFKKGDSFYGQIIPPVAGLIFGAYGTGANPIITGFTTLTSWTNNGGGIWSSNVSAASSSLIAVSIDGKLQQIGRYPNTGYLTYTALNSTGPTITGSALSATTDWTGAEVVIRKQHWILDRCMVTAHSGGTISYTNPVTVNTYFGKVGYGYFFQDDIRTLDQQGEWFLNKSTKDLSVYFGANIPSSYTIKASVIDTLFNCGGFNGRTTRSNISIENIAFEGANETAVIFGNGANISVKNCSFNNCNNAIFLYNVSGTVINNNSLTNTLNNAINITSSTSSNSSIASNTIKNSGMFAGMGNSGDGMYCGIQQAGNIAAIEYNKIDSTGYNALVFQNSTISVRYNYVTNFCMVKDDGGGIYTWSGNGTYTGRLVQNNIVINAQGAAAGTEGTASAHCIYLDGHAMNVDVLNNTVSQASASGIFLNSGNAVRVTGNTIYNVPIAYNLTRMNNVEPLLRTNIFTSNICYPSTNNYFYWNAALNSPATTDIQSDMRAMFTTIDSNYYRNDIAAPFYWFYHLTQGGTFVNGTPVNLAAWKTTIASEANSVALNTAGNAIQVNSTASPVVYNFYGYSKKDAAGLIYSNSVTIPAWGSVLLFDNGSSTNTRTYFIKKRK
jgi:parallel beta-helix repeat protein